MEPYFQVFKKPSDHHKWEKQIEFTSINTEIEDDIRTELVESLKFLNGALGNGFLKTDVSHPFRQSITNKAKWQAQYLIGFVKTLQTLKSYESNYDKVILKLLSPGRSIMEDIPFVETASSFLKQGFDVYFPDENKISKSPDIEIINTNNGDKVLLEFSKLWDSDEKERASKNYHILHGIFNFSFPRIPFSARQLKYISDDEMTLLERKIIECKLLAEKEQRRIEYSDQYIQFIFFPIEQFEDFEKWCEEDKNRRKDLLGVPLNFDDTKRVINKISKEVKQIGSEINGIIYLLMNPLYFMTTDLAQAISAIEKAISRYENLLGVVLYANIIDPIEEQEYFDGKNFYSLKMMNEVSLRHLLFVYNDKCKMTIGKETMNKLYESFR